MVEALIGEHDAVAGEVGDPCFGWNVVRGSAYYGVVGVAWSVRQWVFSELLLVKV